MIEGNEEKIVKPYVEEFLERYELKRLHTAFLERLALFAVAGLGLIAALAWDEAFKEVFTKLFGGLEGESQKFLYAILLTGLTVVVTLVFTSLIKKKAKK